MRRIVATFALAICLVGCGSAPRPDIPIAGDIIGSGCPAEEFVTGVLIADPTLGLAVQGDGGGKTRLVIRMTQSARWVPDAFGGGTFDVLDGNGTVLATTGRSYRIGGMYASFFNGFWACADVWIPQ